ncbi:MAG: Nre family DNA repair protein [Candidatus Methanofastidiosia archaeon]
MPKKLKALLKLPKRESICVRCKGGKMLCGKLSCPLLMRVKHFLKVKDLGRDIFGSSPPGIFIGRFGYPKVFVGPLVPPIHKDTSLYDDPEHWLGLSIEEIVRFRMQLVRGKKRVNIRELSGKTIDAIQELALSKKPVDCEMELEKKPTKRIILDDNVQPMGPSAPLNKVGISSSKTDKRIERAFYDTDLKAREALLELFSSKTPLTRIQKGLAAGLFGVRQNRRLVPTRWSITAVDSTLSLELVEKVKENLWINEILVFKSINLDNRFVVLMIPDAWSYELMEAWYPGTTWNPSGKNIFLFGDSEGYRGRTTYARIGGCYYAARLATCEYLVREKRQAKVVIMREAHPGYLMPVGVWNVRESVRVALRRVPLKFDSLEEALARISQEFDISIEDWMKNSSLLTEHFVQRKLETWF